MYERKRRIKKWQKIKKRDDVKGRLTAENVFNRIRSYNEFGYVVTSKKLAKGENVRTTTVLEFIEAMIDGSIPNEVIYDNRIWFRDDLDFFDRDGNCLLDTIIKFGHTDEEIQVIDIEKYK